MNCRSKLLITVGPDSCNRIESACSLDLDYWYIASFPGFPCACVDKATLAGISIIQSVNIDSYSHAVQIKNNSFDHCD